MYSTCHPPNRRSQLLNDPGAYRERGGGDFLTTLSSPLLGFELEPPLPHNACTSYNENRFSGEHVLHAVPIDRDKKCTDYRKTGKCNHFVMRRCSCSSDLLRKWPVENTIYIRAVYVYVRTLVEIIIMMSRGAKRNGKAAAWWERCVRSRVKYILAWCVDCPL